MSATRKYNPDTIRTLRDHGATAKGIAWILGMPNPTIVYSVVADGWRRRYIPKCRDAETIAIWRAGVERGDTNAQIARAAGVGRSGLRCCLRRWRLRRPAVLPTYGRKCVSCLEPIPTDKRERDGPRCIPCGRRRCRNGSCECGLARYNDAAKCARCGRAQEPRERSAPEHPAAIAFLADLKSDRTHTAYQIAVRHGFCYATARSVARRAGVDVARRAAAVYAERVRARIAAIRSARAPIKPPPVACYLCGTELPRRTLPGRPRTRCADQVECQARRVAVVP